MPIMRIIVCMALTGPVFAQPAPGQDARPVPCAVGDPAVNASYSLEPLGTSWQPRGGEVRLKLKGPLGTLAQSSISVCFRRSFDDKTEWYESRFVHVLETGNQEIVLSAVVPSDLPQWQAWPQRLFAPERPIETTLIGIVPIATVRVTAPASFSATGAGPGLDVTTAIGVTSYINSLFWAIFASVLGCVVLRMFNLRRRVPGNDWLLQVISTRAGVASLAQFQIILWSFVVGFGAIYVMALSGTMIDISSGTLALLGITGVAVIGSKLSGQTGGDGPALVTTPAVPGMPTALALLAPATDTVVRVKWEPSGAGGSVTRYVVQYRLSAGPGPLIAARAVNGTSCAILGLTPGTSYDVQVLASNAAGTGAPAVLEGISTAAAPPAGSLLPPTALTVAGAVQENQFGIGFLGAAPPAYLVQTRVRDSDEDWATELTVPGSAVTALITGLRADSAYDVRVLACDPATGQLSSPSSTLTVTTAASERQPRWSDLVVVTDGRNEMDVTRVQMLFFTVVSAAFVLSQILAKSMIPEIPMGFVTLMGISNGVYLTSKFVPRGD
jgi:hypothetical protein